jgi:anti-sigma-K factor RskA
VTDELTPEEEREALAAELALGLLEGQARADALRLRLSEPDFAASVAQWEERLGPLYDRFVPAVPGEELFARIEAMLPPAARQPTLHQLRRWRLAAAGSAAVAAALALVLLFQPPPAPVPAAPQLAVARIEGAAAGPLVRASLDRGSGRMRLAIEGIAPGELAPELWVIPAGGKPVSLGQISRSGSAEMEVSPEQRTLLQDGATLAITMEPVSSAPHAAPGSAPVAAGKIIFI